MFKKLVKNGGLKLDGFADFFYKKNYNGYYEVCQDSGFEYFGEFLERYAQVDINPMAIVQAVACEPGALPSHQIYEGQLEGFISTMNELIMDDTDFLNNLCYGIFLYKVGYISECEKIIKDLISNNQLDENFLILTAAIGQSHFKIAKEIRDIIVDKLNKSSVSINVLDYVKSSINRNFGLTDITCLPALRVIYKAYNLKPKDFSEEYMYKLDQYKALRKIGTKTSEYLDIKDILSVSAQEYYFLALKVAREVYVDGSSLVMANECIVEKISKNIDANSEIYKYLSKIYIRYQSGSYLGTINLGNIVFDNIDESYFMNSVIAYSENLNKIEYENIRMLFISEEYISFLEGISKDEMTNKIVIDVITNEDDKVIRDRYFNMLKGLETSDFSYKRKLILFDRGYIEGDFISDAFIEEKDSKSMFVADKRCEKDNYGSSYISTIAWMFKEYNFNRTSYEMVNFFIDNNIQLSSCDSGEKNMISNIGSLACKYAENEIIDISKKNEFIKKLEIYYYMYNSQEYYEFILSKYFEEDYKEALNITEEDINEIAKYILDKPYASGKDILVQIKNFLFSESDFSFNDFKIKFNFYIDSWNDNRSRNAFRELLVEYAGSMSLENKVRAREYAVEILLNIDGEGFRNVSMEYMQELLNMSLLTKLDCLSILESYLVYEQQESVA